MMIFLKIALICLTIPSKQADPPPGETYCPILLEEEIALPPSYDTIVRRLKTSRTRLAADRDIDAASTLVTTYLVDSIFPSWYGRPWDFNGHTNRPDTGEVACGYFVSTTLKHAGFNLNRYKFAQQASSIGTKSLDPDGYSVLWNKSVHELENWFENQDPGLWTVGLSYHVGFLYWDGAELWFIHSNYMDPVAVVREKASESEALANTTVFYLGNISHNEGLVAKWLDNEFIEIRK